MNNKMGKRKHFYYVVSLPLINCFGLENVEDLKVMVSTSDRGAVSHALAYKISKELTGKSKGEIIQHAMRQLDKDYGGAGRYAYEIPSGIQESGIDVPQLNPIYRVAQEVFLTGEIAMKAGKSFHQCSKIAKQYLNFYNSHN